MKYHVVIVEAGSEGCVLAARLSEDPSRTVLLLETVPDYPDFQLLSRFPVLISYWSRLCYVQGYSGVLSGTILRIENTSDYVGV